MSKKEEGKELGTLAVQMLITNFLLPSAICFRNRHHAPPHRKKKKKLERERNPLFYTPLPNSCPADTYLPKRGRGGGGERPQFGMCKRGKGRGVAECTEAFFKKCLLNTSCRYGCETEVAWN